MIEERGRENPRLMSWIEMTFQVLKKRFQLLKMVFKHLESRFDYFQKKFSLNFIYAADALIKRLSSLMLS